MKIKASIGRHGRGEVYLQKHCETLQLKAIDHDEARLLALLYQREYAVTEEGRDDD